MCSYSLFGTNPLLICECINMCCLFGSSLIVVCVFLCALVLCFNNAKIKVTEGISKRFPGRVQHAHSVIVQLMFCPFLIRYIFVMSVIHLLHVRLLTVFLYSTCLVCKHSLRLLGRHSPPLRRLPSPDKHFLHFVCLFGVHYFYPLMCYSNISNIHKVA